MPLPTYIPIYRIRLDTSANQQYTGFVSSLHEGRIAIVTDVGWDAVDAGSAEDERRESVRQRRVVPTPRRWRPCTWETSDFPGRDGGKRAVLRGDHVISRKAIAQGMSDVLRCPVCSCAHLLVPLHMRSRVQRASGIPCSLVWGETKSITRALCAAGR